MKIRTLLVDDEGHAIERLRQLCAGHPEIKVVGEAANGPEAINSIRSLAPALLMLDVQLGAMSGMDVLAALEPEELPHVVFMTAYETYAAAAFERDAVDYLLKPCTPERFARAIAKFAQRIRSGTPPQREQLLASWRSLIAGAPAAAGLRREGLFVDDAGRHVFVEFASIDYVEAARNYVVIHVGKKSYCHRVPISALELTLDPERFVRIHKSALVNLAKIEAIESDFNGVFIVYLTGGASCRSGQSYRLRIQQLLRPGRSR